MIKKITVAVTLLATHQLYAGGDISPVEPLVDTPVVTSNALYNVSLKAGTLGAGLDISRMLTDNLGLRFNLNGLSYNDNRNVSNINYDATLKLFTVGLLADYYPLDNNFRISGGAYYNDNHADGTFVPTTSFTFGNNTYTPTDIGKVDAGAYYDNNIAPYIGIGWGGKDVSPNGWSFTVDVGALYQGSTQIYANATVNNPLLANQIKQDVEAERQQIANDIKNYKWYPVVMVGINYTF